MERYLLLNPSAPLRECVRPLGDATAYNVQVSAHESVHKRGEWAARDQLRPGEATTFMVVRTMGTTDSTITVEWSDEPGRRGARVMALSIAAASASALSQRRENRF